jgi:hypothetical protein
LFFAAQAMADSVPNGQDSAIIIIDKVHTNIGGASDRGNSR